MTATAPSIRPAPDLSDLVRIQRPGPGYRLAFVSIPALVAQGLTLPIGDDFRIAPPLAFRPQDFRVPFLAADEIGRLNQFKALKKQVEWMAGRYAAKQLANHFLPDHPPLARTRVDYRTKGAPYFSANPSLSLSISHSWDYAVAGMALSPSGTLGLDLERIRPESRETLLRTAFSPREVQALTGTDDETLFRHWTAKEAYLKYIGMGFHQPLKRIEILNGAILHDGHPVPSLTLVSCRPCPGYAFSMVS